MTDQEVAKLPSVVKWVAECEALISEYLEEQRLNLMYFGRNNLAVLEVNDDPYRNWGEDE